MELVKGLGPQFKNNYLRLIAAGHIESSALACLEVDWIDFFELCSRDPEFRANIEQARQKRADVWVDRIAGSLDKKYTFEDGVDASGRPIFRERAPTKDELGRDKLEFEKCKFLAQADNPEKYAQGAKPKVQVDIDLKDFKLLSPQESIQVLNSDPFNKMVTIETDFEPVEEKKDE